MEGFSFCHASEGSLPLHFLPISISNPSVIMSSSIFEFVSVFVSFGHLSVVFCPGHGGIGRAGDA